MSDQPAASDQQPGTPPAEAKNTEAEHMIPKSRFDEVNRQLRELQQAAQQREQAERQAADEAARAKGEFEKLATERGARLEKVEAEHATRGERVSALEAAMDAQIKARLKALPDEIRDLDPGGDVLARYEWLAKAEKAAAQLTTPPAPRGTNGGPSRGSAPAGNGTNQDLIAEKRARIGAL